MYVFCRHFEIFLLSMAAAIFHLFFNKINSVCGQLLFLAFLHV